MGQWQGPEILIPIGKVMPIAYGRSNRLSRIAGGRHGAAVFRADQTQEISHVFGGRGAKPSQPIVLVGADGRTPICIVTDGQTEAAELEEMALAAQERGTERMKKYGQQMPIAEYRERRGLPQASKFPELFAQALRDRMAKHRASSQTDPSRQPHQDGRI